MSPSLSRVVMLTFLFAGCGSVVFAAQPWRPVTPEELALAPTEAQAEAGAVVLLREMSVDESDLDGSALDHYIRIKVFNDRGIEALAKMEIPFDRSRRIRGLAARVVKPDGTSIEVARDAIFTRDVVRLNRDALSVVAFSFPALEPGCIAEYRFRVQSDDIMGGMRLYLADAFPVALARIRIRPIDFPGFGMRTVWSRNCNLKHLGADKRGFHVFEATDVPVETTEPFAPPNDEVKRWFLFFYTFLSSTANHYWAYMGVELAAMADRFLAPKKPLEEAAKKITAGAVNQEQKLQLLYDYCRTQVKNLSYDVCGFTPEQIEKLKPNKSPADTFKNGYGTGPEINLLFGAMLRSAGLRCYLAYMGDRSQCFFNRELTARSTLPHLVVATDWGPWRFYDPGSLYLPAGKLRWMQERSAALVATKELWEIVPTEASPLEYSTTRRTAKLQLAGDGTLTGDVKVELTGHDAIAAKHRHDALSAEESRALIQAELAERLGAIEIERLQVHNATAPDAPFAVTFHVRVPHFAEFSGERIFLHPSFFEKGRSALFTAEQREFDICFPYPSLEEDEVEINLPAGFELEQPSAPQSLTWNRNVNYLPKLAYSRTAHRLLYQRKYRREFATIGVRAYPVAKAYFNQVRAQDHHTVLLRRVTPPASESAGP